MSTRGSNAMATGLFIVLLAVSLGVTFTGGFGLLLGFTGVLAGINLVAVGVRMADDPTAFLATTLPRIGMLSARPRRNHLASIGLVMASCAVAGVTGEASLALCFSVFALLLLGISLITVGVYDK